MLDLPDGLLAFDTETTGLFMYPSERRRRLGMDPDRPYAFSFCNQEGDTDYFRAAVDPATRSVDYSGCTAQLEWLQRVVGDPRMTVIMHNAAFDVQMTRQIGIRWRCKIHDTKVMAYCLNPVDKPHSLKPLAAQYLGIPVDDERALHKETQRARLRARARGLSIANGVTHHKASVAADYWMSDAKSVERYARMDAYRTMAFYLAARPYLCSRKLWSLYCNEMEVVRTVMRMQAYGTTYLKDNARDLRAYYVQYRDEHKVEAAQLGYGKLNPNSAPQMRRVFVDSLGRKADNTTDSGEPKIDAEQLMKWARGSAMGHDVDGDAPDGCKLSRAILERKAAEKVLTYLDAYDFFEDRRADGSRVVHPAWNSTGAVTGRFSCSSPNTMQVASEETSRRHSHVRAQQRRCFGPRPGHLWYMPDYSQIEVWIFAFVAKEPSMMDALLHGHDFHLSTAQAAWGDRPDFEELKKWWRQRAKMILFSKLYGGGVGKIASLIRCSTEEAWQFLVDFDEKLPGVRRYMDDLIDSVTRTGMLTNLFGRQYPISRNKAYRAVNYMVQGSAAEVMKRALVRLDKLCKIPRWKHVRLVGTVHDEAILELPIKVDSPELRAEVIRLMQVDSHYVPNLPRPLPVSMKLTYTNWSEAKEVAP